MADPIGYTPEDLDIATRTVDGEARGEPRLGQQAVAWVIRNRADWSPPSWWGHTISECCQKPWQFSCWNGGPDTQHISAIEGDNPEYIAIQNLVKSVFDGDVEDPTYGSTMYKVSGSIAEWDNAVALISPVIIGKMSFWKLAPNA
jgi:N-acetylmuramoyl-L-alanine amidase